MATTATTTTKFLVPNFLWAQDRKNVFLKIDVTDIVEKDMKVDIKKEGLEFTGTANGKTYQLALKFRFPINPTTARYAVKRLVSFFI